MDRSYVNWLVQDVIRDAMEPGGLYEWELDGLEVRDWRGAVELRLLSIPSLLALSEAVERHGWQASPLHHPDRLMFGFSFPLEAGDVAGLSLVVPLTVLRDWTRRFRGQDRVHVPGLVRAAELLVNGPGSLRERAAACLAAERSYVSSKEQGL